MTPDPPPLEWAYERATKSFLITTVRAQLRWGDVRAAGTAAVPQVSAKNGAPVAWPQRATVNSDGAMRLGDRFTCTDNANLRLVHEPTGTVLLDNRKGKGR